ncbi:MAG: glycoside hydrolase family 16 protein [Deltaproteobacteria bacterium]|nr:glycoside hydrolase family 16 protein [Deltaproteobacteria bacterium]
MKNLKIYIMTIVILQLLSSVSLGATDVLGGELYTKASYKYGKFEAKIKFAAGDGVISSFFLWKPDSEQDSVYWNELDFEKITDNCNGYSTNIHWGESTSKTDSPLWVDSVNLCDEYHIHTIEWTDTSITWFLDGKEIRKITDNQISEFNENSASGMQFRFNLWVGNASFGGTFTPSILPVYQYIDWVQYSSFTPGAGDDGTDFTIQWKDEFNEIGANWLKGSWLSPFGNSQHSSQNVNICNGAAVISLSSVDNPGPPSDCNGEIAGDTETSLNDTEIDTEISADTSTENSTTDFADSGNNISDSDLNNSSSTKTSDQSGCSFTDTFKAPSILSLLLI